MFRRDKLVSRTLSVLLSAIIAAPTALADPPAHAPAHGWRAKQAQPYYVGYDGHHWSRDYGVREGRCDRDEVGAVLGAVAGGAIGSTVAQGDQRIVAILHLAVPGAGVEPADHLQAGSVDHAHQVGARRGGGFLGVVVSEHAGACNAHFQLRHAASRPFCLPQ